MKKLRVTVNGTAYDVEVELLEDLDGAAGYGFPSVPAPGVAAQRPSLPPAQAEVSQAVKRPPSSNRKELTSPIAGTITEIKAAVGDTVKENDLLMVIEAMKMNTHISSPVAGRIASIGVKAGDGVTQGQVLLTFA